MKPPDLESKSLTRITCAQHVTPYLRGEVEALGHEIQQEDHVAVHIGASLRECMDLNLKLRTGHHVMWLLKRFRCPSPNALYTHATSYPWEMLIPADSYVCVTSNVEHPKVTNSMYTNLLLKDAIVDRISKQTGARPDSGPDRSQVVIHLSWKNDRAWIYLNTTGQWLADRGYRKIPHSAPMRETLAAAVLLAAGYDGTQPLVNPMCGSGTLAIEGALIATRRAPGLLRSNYSILHTCIDHEDQWKGCRAAVRKQKQAGCVPPIIATDHDPAAIDAARRNAQAAGVEQLIDFRVCDFAQTLLPDSRGHIILNPEYGERMGEIAELAETYKAIGDYFKQKCAGWNAHVFTGSRELAGKIGLRSSQRLPFMNAQIECRLLSYEMYASQRNS